MVTIKKWQEYWYMENSVFTCQNLSLKLGSLHLLNFILSDIFAFWARFLIICSNFVTMKLSIWAKKHAQTQFEQILFWSEPSFSMKFTFEVTEEFPHSETSCYNYNSTATVCTLKIIFKDTIISHFQFSFVYE